MNAFIRAYDEEKDLKGVFDLWQSIFSETWPLRQEAFRKVTSGHRFYQPGDHWVAVEGEKIVGFASTQVARGKESEEACGGLSALFIDAGRRRQGIGRALHQAALDHLRQCGMKRALLGGAGIFRFWPGVPGNLPEAKVFFQDMGWEDFSLCFDLVRTLEDYTTPPGILEKMAIQQIDLQPARIDEIAEVLKFEEAEFPGWALEFHLKAELGAGQDILVARDARGRVVGTLLMFTPQSPYLAVNMLWQGILGEPLGGMGSVGVKESERGRGIGVALVGCASEILRERGVYASMIDYTNLDVFYGKVGYRRWRDYHHCMRDL